MTVRTVLILSLLFCARLAAASTNAMPVRVEAADGSTLIGEALVSNIQIQTSFADLSLPIDQVAAIRFTDTNGSVAVRLRNGDALGGKTSLKQFSMRTVLGNVAIPLHILQTVTVMASGGVLPPGLFDSLVLHYTFDADEGDRVTDRSSRGNHGKVFGKPTFVPDGKVGGALVLDGQDDYVDVGNPASLQLQSDFTLMAWLRLDSLAQSGALIAKSPNTDQARRAIEMYLTDRRQFGGYFWNQNSAFFSGTSVSEGLPDGQWLHLALQHDSSLPAHQMRMFVNGKEEKISFVYESVASIPLVRKTEEPFRIGCFSPGRYHLKGRVDEVLVFNKVLTQDEISTIYGSAR